MADDKGKTPFFENPRFRGTVAVIGLVSAVFALVGIPKLFDVISEIFKAEAAALSNTEVILDTSGAMSDPFQGSQTKLKAAVSAIGQAAPGNDEGLALRRTGSDCGAEEEEPLVDFAKGNRNKVLSVAAEQHPEGRSNVVKAVIEAVGDFRANPEFNGPSSTRRVLVFTTGRDECFHGNVANKIGTELEEDDLSASFTFIALNVSGQALAQLKELKSALKAADANVESYAPQDSGELEEDATEVREEAHEAVEEGRKEKKKEDGTSG